MKQKLTHQFAYDFVQKNAVPVYLIAFRDHTVGKCAGCKKTVKDGYVFCSEDTYVVIDDKRSNGHGYISECLYEFINQHQSEILEIITS